MNASPAMDTGAPLLCHGALAVLQGPAGTRRVDLAELWTGPGRTSAATDELLVAVELPAPAAGTGSAYVRLQYRRQMEIAIVGAGRWSTSADGRVTDARVAITALAPTIHRVPEAEAALVGSGGGTDAAASRRGGRRGGARPDLRRPRLGRLPPGDGRGHGPPGGRGRPAPGRPATRVSVPASDSTYGRQTA